MHWLAKLLGRIFSVVVLLLIIGLIILGDKVYDISFIFFNIQQSFSGSFGDKFIVAGCTTLICTMLARRYLLTATGLTEAAGLLALSGLKREQSRQQLVLLSYLAALTIRFCGCKNETKSQMLRLRSRFWEYLMYMWLPRCHLLLDLWILLPSAVFVSGRQDVIRKQLTESGSWGFQHMKHFDSQYTFLWVEGFLARIDIAVELVTNKDDMKTMARKIFQWEWFHDLLQFFHVLMEGTPLEEVHNHKHLVQYWLRILEGYELMCYVIFFGLAHATTRACLVCFAVPLKLIMGSIQDKWSKMVKDTWSDKIAPSLAYVAVQLSAPDIHKVTRTIIEAEAALNSRKQCTVCIETMDAALQLNEFKMKIGYNVNHYSRGAFDMALCGMAFASVEEVDGNYQIVRDLRNLLILIRLYHKSMFEPSSDDVKKLREKLAVELGQFSLIHYENGYKVNTALVRQCGCIGDGDWKVMKAQLCVSLLLQAHDQPREGENLSFTAVMLWMEKRKVLHAEVDIPANEVQA
ncbi:hypothetical protein SELMODRAFT_421910 [Selaginella moellendorffii]|uniref:DUF4220 domain-containing protein n=1 Tax=Selaginella moellendorffii TaxID=88036 RepID=D8SGQ9_SELML|nr:hypothetical protein SELMODRAFT_421910 [Selaginella moellendorffii]